MMVDFLRDPDAPPDASCIGETLPPNFQGWPAFADYVFGTEDLWENEGTRKSKTDPPRQPSFFNLTRRPDNYSFYTF